jgi:hypothetical protein
VTDNRLEEEALDSKPVSYLVLPRGPTGMKTTVAQQIPKK